MTNQLVTKIIARLAELRLSRQRLQPLLTSLKTNVLAQQYHDSDCGQIFALEWILTELEKEDTKLLRIKDRIRSAEAAHEWGDVQVLNWVLQVLEK